jgi:hypothetical protein
MWRGSISGMIPRPLLLLKEQARRRAVNFAGPLLDKADRD